MPFINPGVNEFKPKTMFHKTKEPRTAVTQEMATDLAADGYRDSYQKRKYPRTLFSRRYHQDGKTTIVQSEEDEQRAIASGVFVVDMPPLPPPDHDLVGPERDLAASVGFKDDLAKRVENIEMRQKVADQERELDELRAKLAAAAAPAAPAVTASPAPVPEPVVTAKPASKLGPIDSAPKQEKAKPQEVTA